MVGEVARAKETRFCMFNTTHVLLRGDFANNCTSRLKLQVYRSLGIDVSQDPNTGVFNRAVIRNPAKGDVNVVNVDGKVDRKVYADMFWDSL